MTPKVEALTGEKPVAAMLFREASIQQRLVNVRAADDLNKWVTLVSGRLPKPCVPSHCEVLRLKGTGPIPATKDLNLIEVGRATLKPDAPFGPFVLPTPPTEQVARAVRYHTPQPSPTVIANGVAALSKTPRARDVLPRVRLVPPGRARRGAPVGDRRVRAEGRSG